MGLINMFFSASILIYIILILRIINIRIIPKTTYLVLWKIAMVRMLIPFVIPIKINLLDNFSLLLHENKFVDDIQVKYPLLIPNNIKFEMDIISNKKSLDFSWILMTIWIVGMILILVSNIIKYIYNIRLLREAITIGKEADLIYRLACWAPKRNIKILCFDRIISPFTVGIFHPKIILPSNMSNYKKDELKYILVHEFVHIVRNDNLWKIIALISVSVHWFNPLAWLMYYSLQRDIEIACDEKVIAYIGDTRKKDYAQILIQLAEKQSGISPFYSSFGKNSIEERIVSIMKYKKITRLGVVVSLILIILAGTTFLSYANEKSNYNPLYDPSVNKELYISDVHEKNEDARQYYPVNDNGYTYGPDIYSLSDVEPDLMAVENEEGILGYCYREDLNGKLPDSIEEALASMEKWKNGKSILIYESDGETVLGIFKISKGVTR